MKKILPVILIVIFSFTAVALPVLAADDYGLNKTAGTAGLTTGLAKKTVPEIIGSIIGIALSLIGLIFMILLVYGGFLWMTSYGDKTKVEKAKDLITSAVIGLIIVIGAYALSKFIIDALVGA